MNRTELHSSEETIVGELLAVAFDDVVACAVTAIGEVAAGAAGAAGGAGAGAGAAPVAVAAGSTAFVDWMVLLLGASTDATYYAAVVVAFVWQFLTLNSIRTCHGEDLERHILPSHEQLYHLPHTIVPGPDVQRLLRLMDRLLLRLLL